MRLNQQIKKKKDKYAILMSKLKKATDNEYYYEAIFLEYAILEDRTESLLKHANICIENKKGFPLKLSEKLNKIKDGKEFQDSYIKKHLINELLSIYDWKCQRDKLMHDIVNLNYENSDIKMLALNGECIIKKLNNKTKLVNNLLDKNSFQLK